MKTSLVLPCHMHMPEECYTQCWNKSTKDIGLIGKPGLRFAVGLNSQPTLRLHTEFEALQSISVGTAAHVLRTRDHASYTP